MAFHREFFHCTAETILTTLKMAEEDSYVVRLYHSADDKGMGEVSLFDRKTPVVCTEGQVLTLKTTSDGFTETNLLEE